MLGVRVLLSLYVPICPFDSLWLKRQTLYQLFLNLPFRRQMQQGEALQSSLGPRADALRKWSAGWDPERHDRYSALLVD